MTNSRSMTHILLYGLVRRSQFYRIAFSGPSRKAVKAAPVPSRVCSAPFVRSPLSCSSVTLNVPSAATAGLQLLDLSERKPGPNFRAAGDNRYMTYAGIKIYPSDESTASTGTAHRECRGLPSHHITSLLHSMATGEGCGLARLTRYHLIPALRVSPILGREERCGIFMCTSTHPHTSGSPIDNPPTLGASTK
jgi:hypothetical protein